MRYGNSPLRPVRLISACLGALALTGCPDPNAIGVQQTGSVTAQCLLSSNNQPVVDALVVLNSNQNCRTGSDGRCTIDKAPVGSQTLTANAPGLQGGPVSTTVVEGQNATVQIPMTPSNG